MKRINQKKIIALFLLISLMTYALPVLALGTPAFIGGVKSLISDATKWIMGLAAGAGTLMFIYHQFMSNFTEDPSEKGRRKKTQKEILVGVVLILIAGTIISVISAYFA